MSDSKRRGYESRVVGLPRIPVPLPEPPTPEELERRRIIIERIIERHDRVGPIGIKADDLHHIAEDETERRYE